jgi:prophage antirepressor-like protein
MTATAQKIIPFAFDDNLVRVYKPNGEPWFVGRDVCRVLEIKNESDALKRLDLDERQDGVVITDPMGREQSVIVISEAGVFRLIFASRKPEAERFKRWLAHEVLPSLRKQGFYGQPAAAAEPMIEFPREDAALSEHLAKVATLRECRLIHGHRAAARLWRRLGMPAVEESAVFEADQGRACLAYLLDTELHDTGTHKITLRHLISLCLDSEGEHHLDLRKHGIQVIDDTGFIVANGHSFLLKAFERTPWSNNRWPTALRKLPGAAVGRKLYYDDGQHRGTFIPEVLLEELRPAPSVTGSDGTVVQLHR